MTLDEIRADADGRVYPDLHGGDALLLYGAGFLGGNDGIFCLDAGLRGTVVDTDLIKLAAMASLYPSSWGYFAVDAVEFGYTMTTSSQKRWDVVSVDPHIAGMASVAEYLPLWCQLARRQVILGCAGEIPSLCAAWKLVDVLKCTEKSYWSVYHRVGT